MYSLPSTSVRSAPRPRVKKTGSPPTALKARTGELTPPGMTWRAFSNRLRDSVMARASAAQEARRLLGEIGHDDVRPGAADGDERLQENAVEIDPAVPGGGREHRVLPRHIVGRPSDLSRPA